MQTAKIQTSLMTRRMVECSVREFPALVKLSVPLVLGMSISALIGMTDTIMLAPLGTETLAIVSLTMSVQFLLIAALYGLISVIGVAMANAFGAKDHPLISSVMRHALWLALFCGGGAMLLMVSLMPLAGWLGLSDHLIERLPGYWLPISVFLVPFSVFLVHKALFDAVNRPWLAVGFAFLGVVLNIPLNLVLIYGFGPIPALGLLGSGTASLLAEGIALIVAFCFWRFSAVMKPYRLFSRVTMKGLWRQFSDGYALGLGYLAENGALTVASVLMLGWFGASALAAEQIVSSIEGLLYMVPLGMATSVGIRLAQARGGGEQERLRPIAVAAFAFVFLWMLVITLFLTLFGHSLAWMFSDDTEVVTLASSMFIVVAAMQIVDGVQSTALGALRGINDTKIPAVLTVMSYWGLALPLAYLLAFTFKGGPVMVWVGFGFGLLVAAILLPWRFFCITKEGGDPAHSDPLLLMGVGENRAERSDGMIISRGS